MERNVEEIGGVIGKRFVPELRLKFERERDWIGLRIQENREKLRDDFSVATLGDIVGIPGQDFLLDGDDDE